MSDTFAGGSVANDSDTSTVLGNWAGGDFGSTVSQYGAVGADTDLPEETRFVAGVVQLLQRRMAQLEAQGQTDDDDIAIFVLKPIPPDSIHNAPREPMFDNGRAMVVGRLWFTAASVVSARYVDLPQDRTDDVRFSYVANQLALGGLPTMIFDPRTAPPQLRWYPEGLGKPDTYELKPLSGNVSPEDVLEAITRLYQNCFVTPDGLPSGVNLWTDASKHRPRKDAEKMVQSLLKAGLVLRFPFCKILHEQPQVEGRTDLEIHQTDPLDRSSVTHHAILELKVLRSFWSTGSTVSHTEINEWIKHGVIQAVAYRASKGSRWSALCCFDMRRDDVGDDSCFDHVRDGAAKSEVELWRWYLYTNAEAYREATISI